MSVVEIHFQQKAMSGNAIKEECMTTRTLYTIGHSNHKLEIFLSYLKDYQITHLIDVRTTPQSRWNPQYNRNSLNTSLRKEGIGYNHLGDVLGGKPKWVEDEWLKGKACDRDYTEFFFRDDFRQGVRPGIIISLVCCA